MITSKFTKCFGSLQMGGPGLKALALGAASLLFAAIPAHIAAQIAPPYLITTQATIPTPSGFGGPNGNLATDKFGNVFVPDAAHSQVLEFPANGGPSIVIFDATKTGPQVSGVAVDANNNLYVTTRYDGSLSAAETDIFEFPYSSGYPGPYTYTGTAAPRCTATGTGVCMYGNFLQTTGGYYQPQAIGFDAAGNGYMITTYDSLNGAGGKTVYACTVTCGLGVDSATVAVAKFPTTATSLAVAPNGDLYLADGTDVYLSRAGSGTVQVFDKSFESSFGGAAGVGFDRAGNLYVSNSGGTYEILSINGTITAGTGFQVAQSAVGGYTGPAVDSNGNIYSAAYSTLLKSSLFNGNFGTVPVGTPAAALTFTIQFLSPGTINSLTALQSGAASTEFLLDPGTCTPATHMIGDTCTFSVTFTPGAVGIRRGSVVMTDSSAAQTSVYLLGVGQGTGLSIDPGTPTSITTTLKAPSGIAVDSTGNVFVADATAAAVYEYVGGSGAPVTVVSGLTKPTGVATDGAGNLYVVDQGAGTLKLYTRSNASFTTNPRTIASGLTSPTDVIVSGSGAIYLSNTGKNEIRLYPNASRTSSLTTSLSLGVGLNGPTGLSLDPSGNLYIADTGNNRAVQLTYAGSQSTFGTGLLAPTGVAAEPSGSVLIADQGNGRILRVPNEGGTLTTADQVSLSQPLINPYSLRLSANGTLYVTDNQAGAIEQLQRTAATLNFGISNVNTSTTAQTVVVSSTGTADLTLGSPFFTPPPASSNFTLAAGTPLGCAPGTLATGRACTLSSVFTPTSTGSKTTTVAFNASAGNAATSTLTLVGQGVQLSPVTVTLTKTSPTGTVTYGVPVILTATVASNGTATSVPTGTVTFSVDGQNTKPVTLSSTGTASYTLSGLGGNTTHTVVATYNGGAVYASGSSTLFSVTVQPATTSAALTIFADALTPLSANIGSVVSFSLPITASVAGSLTGTVNFVSGNTILGSSPITQDNKGAYSAGFSSAALPSSCKANEVLPNCSNIYQVQAVFAGNGNYSGFTTPAQTLTIVTPQYTIVPSSTTITSTAAQYGTTTLTISSYSAFQAGVALTCSGLPANAYCIFRPGLISLTTAPSTSGTLIPVQTVQMQIRVSQDPINIQSAAAMGLIGLVTACGVFLIGMRRKGVRGLVLCCLVGILSGAGLGALTGCGSSSPGSSAYPTPAGTYPITLNATASVLGGGASAQAPTVYTFSSIKSTGNIATAVTTASTGYTVGQMVTVTGASPAAFNGTFPLLSVTQNPPIVNPVTNVATYTDTLTYQLPVSATTSGSGGYVRAANLSLTQAYTLIVK